MKIHQKELLKLISECIREEIESDDNAFYVEYLKDLPGEDPFMLQGKKFQYVLAKYPSGKKDIGVYSFSGDIVLGYNTFRKQYNLSENIKESQTEKMASSFVDRFVESPRFDKIYQDLARTEDPNQQFDHLKLLLKIVYSAGTQGATSPDFAIKEEN